MNVVDIITTTPHFSERELDILKHVALGMSAKEISKEIGLAPRTVERHVENIRMKLRAINSPHMVLCAIFYGVINMPKISDVLADHPILRL